MLLIRFNLYVYQSTFRAIPVDVNKIQLAENATITDRYIGKVDQH